nr:putative dual specificity protein phosphatase DSP8 [Ipomoea batatas]
MRKVVVGVGARALFYPTLLYNVVRNRIQTEFRWWDWIDEFVLLGAVPFPSDVKRLKKLGVCGVVTLNEPYETLVPTSLYRASTLKFVRYKQMTPTDAYEYVKAIRPRVLLASSQWKAVQEFYSHLMMETGITYPLTFPISRSPGFMASKNLLAFDDSSALIITEADLDGYDPGNIEPGAARNERRSDFGLIWRVRIAGVAALSRVSCLWLNCQPPSKRSIVQLAPVDTVDIHDTHKPRGLSV